MPFDNAYFINGTAYAGKSTLDEWVQFKTLARKERDNLIEPIGKTINSLISKMKSNKLHQTNKTRNK